MATVPLYLLASMPQEQCSVWWQPYFVQADQGGTWPWPYHALVCQLAWSTVPSSPPALVAWGQINTCLLLVDGKVCSYWITVLQVSWCELVGQQCWQRQVPCLTWLWDPGDGFHRPGHVAFVRTLFCYMPWFLPVWCGPLLSPRGLFFLMSLLAVWVIVYHQDHHIFLTMATTTTKTPFSFYSFTLSHFMYFKYQWFKK